MKDLQVAGDFDDIAAWLHRWDRRRRLALLALWLPRALLLALTTALALSLLARWRPFLLAAELLQLALALSAFFLVFVALIVLIPRRTVLQQARSADRHLALQERASTAVEIHSGQIKTSVILRQQQMADTLSTLEARRLKKRPLMHLHWRELMPSLLVLVLLAIMLLLPNPQEVALRQRRAVQQAVINQREQLEILAQQLDNEPDLTEAERAALVAPVEAALAELSAEELSQEEALAVLSEAAAELRALAGERANPALDAALERSAAPLADSQAGQELAQALANGELAAASQAVGRMADGQESDSDDENAALAEDLAEAADALSDVDPQLSQELEAAVAALAQGDTTTAEERLRQAAATLQDRGRDQIVAARAAEAAESVAGSAREVAEAGSQRASDGSQVQSGQPEAGRGEGANDGLYSDGSGATVESDVSGDGVASDGNSVQPGGPGPGGGQAERVFVPDPVELADEAGVDIELPAECRLNPERCGALLSEQITPLTEAESLVPYDQVFGQYRDEAYEALEQDYVPLALKGLVRDYFSSLEP
ncbi:MAG: hypothetical protein R3300_04415 [Candidatus Promineifilaceae bacterium]|nr:hypothetical protein [Candidatus Promineifilaceae bacterium]